MISDQANAKQVSGQPLYTSEQPEPNRLTKLRRKGGWDPQDLHGTVGLSTTTTTCGVLCPLLTLTLRWPPTPIPHLSVQPRKSRAWKHSATGQSSRGKEKREETLRTTGKSLTGEQRKTWGFSNSDRLESRPNQSITVTFSMNESQ